MAKSRTRAVECAVERTCGTEEELTIDEGELDEAEIDEDEDALVVLVSVVWDGDVEEVVDEVSRTSNLNPYQLNQPFNFFVVSRKMKNLLEQINYSINLRSRLVRTRWEAYINGMLLVHSIADHGPLFKYCCAYGCISTKW